MYKSAMIFLISSLVMLLPFGISINAIGITEDMANNNYYKSQNSDYIKKNKM